MLFFVNPLYFVRHIRSYARRYAPLARGSAGYGGGGARRGRNHRTSVLIGLPGDLFTFPFHSRAARLFHSGAALPFRSSGARPIISMFFASRLDLGENSELLRMRLISSGIIRCPSGERGNSYYDFDS